MAPDTSTLEYVGALCAQALQLNEAVSLADRAIAAAAGGSGGAAAAHAAARVRLAACRGAALAGAWKRCASEAAATHALLGPEGGGGEADGGEGGGEGGGGEGGDGRALFKRHQREESRLELRGIEALAATTPLPAMPLLLRRTLPLPPAALGADAAVAHAAHALERAFGAQQWCAKLERDVAGSGDAEAAALQRRLRRVLAAGAAGKAGKASAASAASAARVGPLELAALLMTRTWRLRGLRGLRRLRRLRRLRGRPQGRLRLARAARPTVWRLAAAQATGWRRRQRRSPTSSGSRSS